MFQRLNEDFVRKPDYALSSVGASIDLEKTSSDYEDQNTAYFWNRLSFWNYARPPSVILEVGLEPEGLGTVPRGKSWGQESAWCREEWSPGQFGSRRHPPLEEESGILW